MEAIIKIRDFRIHCVLGAHAHERDGEQEISIDLDMKVNIAEAAQTDSVVDTVDYEAVCNVCKQLAQSRSYHLLETFAYEALHAVLDTFTFSWVRICVKKTFPLVRYAAIELEKAR